MNNQKHKSMRPNPGVKKIQNYLFKFCDFLGKGNFSSVYKGINEVTSINMSYSRINCSHQIHRSQLTHLRKIEVAARSGN